MLLVALSTLLPARAQDSSQFALDTVAIRSTRLAQTRGESGRHITVLTAADIARLPANSVDEVLRYLTGVEVQSRNGFGAQADVIIRGSTFSQVLFLLDGLRLNDPLTGHFNSYVPVSLAEIERIEVLRGPAAAMYGPDAVGGVVHVMTRAFAAGQPDGQHLSGYAQGGEWRLVQAGLGYYSQTRRLRVGAGAQLNQSPGQPLPHSDDGARGDFALANGSLALGVQLAPQLSLTARSAYDQRTFNARYFYTISPADRSREQTRQWWHQARLRHTGSRGSTDLDLGYKVMEDSFLFNPAFAANIHRTTYLNAQLHHLAELNPYLRLAVGAQADRRSIESSDRGNHSDEHAGAYVLAMIRPVAGLAVNASLRGDWDANYGFELLPQANLSYTTGTGWTARLAAGRSIRAADFTERYISRQLPSVAPGRNLGNPDLRAEQAWNYEAGADWQINPWLRLSSTAFLREGRDLIDYVLTPAAEIAHSGNLQVGGSYFFTQNIARVRTYGSEWELHALHQVRRDLRLEGRLGYTQIRSEGPDAVPSKYLANHAGDLLTTSFAIRYQRIEVGVNGLWKTRDASRDAAIGANLSPSYTVWNAQVQWTLLPGLGLEGRVMNLFDARYQDLLGAQMPGRWLMAGLRWRIGGAG
ncbi:MAG: TonB-dependent receptor plug domain-containing protein [Bacteroidia bacterium]